MSTMQIVGIAVASLVVLLIVIALLVSRRRGATADEAELRPAGAFLDDAPQDTLASLGRADQPVEDVTIDPGVHRATNAVPAAGGGTAAGGIGLDWGPELNPGPSSRHHPAPAKHPSPAPAPVPETDETEITGDLGAMSGGSHQAPASVPDSYTESGTRAAATQPARPAEGGSAVDNVAASESGSGGRMMPLSDIIVTTSSKLVDLDDEEVRRMLTDLVTFEIDQAAEFRRQGQTIDAVLQLTEAEKVSRALGMAETAEHIRRMMEDVQGRG